MTAVQLLTPLGVLVDDEKSAVAYEHELKIVY